MPKVGEVVDQLEENFPLELQEEWDNSGSFKVFREEELKGIVLSLDPTLEAFNLALEVGANLVITHHPFTLKPFKNLELGGSKEKIVDLIFSKRISLYSLHTNLDWAWGGVNDEFCKMLGAEVLEPLEEIWLDGYKVVVFLPEDFKVKTLLEAMDRENLGGVIGDYSMCSFFSQGTGTFLPSQKANPFVGEKGKLNLISELRLEMRVEKGRLHRLFHLIKKIHPYEEPAVEVFPVKIPAPGGRGRVATFSEDISSEELLEKLSSVSNNIFHIGKLPERIKKIGVCLGKGISLYSRALEKGVDIFITGDTGYHDRMRILEEGTPVIDVGHEAERIGLQSVKRVVESLGEVFIYQ